MGYDTSKCIEIIADETASSGVYIDEYGKIKGYHIVVDTYPLLPHEMSLAQESELTATQTPETLFTTDAIGQIGLMLCLGAVSLVAFKRYSASGNDDALLADYQVQA